MTSLVGTVVSSISDLRQVANINFNQAFVTGYDTSGDGGGGPYYYDSTDTTSLDNGGTIIVTSDGGRWKLIDHGYLTVKQFGAKGDGSTDDSAAITAAHAYVQSVGCKLHFPHGTYVLKVAYTLYINQTSWIGDNATLDFTGLTGTGYALTLDSTSSYLDQAQQVRYALQGINLHGGSSTSRGTASGIFFGNSNGNAYVSCFSIDQFVVEGFATNIGFGNNVWKVKMSNGIVRWGPVTVPPGLVNFGENMVAENVFFADTDTFGISAFASGEWHLNHCSFDNFEINFSDGVNVFGEGCHFEKPGLQGVVVNSYIRLTGGQNTTVRLSNCEFVGGYSSVTMAPFYVDDTVTSGGLFFDGCVTPNSANINLSNETRSDKLLFVDSFVCGKGRATFTDSRTAFMPSMANYAGCSTSYTENLVNNGNLASGAIAPFVQQFGVPQASPSITGDSNSPTGKVCTIFMSSAQSNCGWITNKIPVKPGQVVSSRIIGGIFGLLGGDTAAFNMIFEDSGGNSIPPSPTLYQTTTSNLVPYQVLYPNATVAPDGAVVVYVQLQIFAGANAGTREFSIGAVSLTTL